VVSNVKLIATATAIDGVLRQMQFFANGVLIGTATQNPYQVIWKNVPEGNYTILATGSDVSGKRRNSPPINITVQNPPTIYPAPPNDNFANRIPIHGAEITLTNSDEYATHEPGEPQIELTGYPNSIWWSWTAPASGTVTISTPTLFTTVAVYTGSSLTNLNLVTAGYQGVTFDVSAGAAYDITAVGYPGDVVLQLIISNLRIASPTNGELFVTGTNITLQAQPTATEQPVQQMEYFRNGVSLGIASASPYALAWTNLPGGDSSLTAVATDWAGYARSSPAVTIHVSPPNDSFTQAIELNSDYVHIVGSTAGASLEPGEPGPPESDNTGRSVWYSWTPPTTGVFSIVATPDLGLEMALQVFTGSEVGNLSPVTGTVNQLATTFTAVEGTRYDLQLIDADGINFALDIAHVPSNDDFTNAFLLAGTNVITAGNNLMAAAEPGEPNHTGRNPGGHSVWYTWTAPYVCFVTLAATGTNFPPVVNVYTGTNLSTLSAVGTNSPAGVSFVAAAGTTYEIAVDGAGGSFSLNLSLIPPPGNDDFGSRFLLTGMNPTAQGTAYLASFQPGEPNFYPWIVDSSVWYSWVAPANGTVWVHCPSRPTAVYTGDNLTNLVVVAPVSPSSFADLAFTATAGTEYEIAVAGAWWLTNQFTLSLVMPKAQIASPTNGAVFPAPASFEIVAHTIDLEGSVVSVSFFDGTNLLGMVTNAPFQFTYHNVPAGSHLLSLQSVDENGLLTTSEQIEVRVQPSNDNFAQRVLINGTETNWVADNSGATTEPGEYLPGGASGRTLWWCWTAPTNGTVTIGSAAFSTASVTSTTAIDSAVASQTATNEVQADDVIVTGPGWGPPGPTTGPLLAVYLNTSITNLSLCASNSGWYLTGEITVNPVTGAFTYDGDWYVLPSFSFPVSEGQTYQISLDGINASYGPAGINFLFAPAPMPPANDDFAQAKIVAGSVLTTTGTTAGATSQLGEPLFGADPAARTVWYSWTAVVSGTVQVSASVYNSSDLKIGAFAGSSIWTLIPVAAGSDQISFYALAGITYKIVVGDTNLSATGFSLALNGSPPPPRLIATRQSNGSYQIQVTGVVGQSFVIQTSLDSANWASLRTDTLIGTNLNFTETAEAGSLQQYFRLLPLDAQDNAQPFVLLPPSVQPGAGFTLHLAGISGQPFRVQVTTNLLDWNDLTSGILVNDFFDFTDPDSANFSSRFYRAFPQ